MRVVIPGYMRIAEALVGQLELKFLPDLLRILLLFPMVMSVIMTGMEQKLKRRKTAQRLQLLLMEVQS